MRIHPPDVIVSETCIDANWKMVERRDPDNFPVSRRRNDERGQYPKLPLSYYSRDYLVRFEVSVYHGGGARDL